MAEWCAALDWRRMLIPVKTLVEKFGVNPTSILHVGAHEAEELEAYKKVWKKLSQPIYWVEGQVDLAKALGSRLDSKKNVVIQAFVWNENGVELLFNVASNSQSSSLLKFGTHEMKIPEVQFTDSFRVVTRRLDSILPAKVDFEFINLDLQGVELQALQGYGAKIRTTKWIYTEVNREQVYEGCTNVRDLDAYLATFGFKRLATRWAIGLGWGDALYVRDPSLGFRLWNKSTFYFREIARTWFIKTKLVLSNQV
jgi:FkbM family methyltransferase